MLTSGGLDSTVALQWAINFGQPEDQIEALFFDYGIPANKGEEKAVEAITDEFGIDLTLIPLDLDVPGSYLDKTDPYIPYRNAELILAAAKQIRRDGLEATTIPYIITGIYPDDRFKDTSRDFVNIMQALLAIEPPGNVPLLTSPLMDGLCRTKKDVINFGLNLGVEQSTYEKAYSCLWGETECGECGKCKEKAELLGLVVE